MFVFRELPVEEERRAFERSDVSFLKLKLDVCDKKITFLRGEIIRCVMQGDTQNIQFQGNIKDIPSLREDLRRLMEERSVINDKLDSRSSKAEPGRIYDNCKDLQEKDLQITSLMQHIKILESVEQAAVEQFANLNGIREAIFRVEEEKKAIQVHLQQLFERLVEEEKWKEEAKKFPDTFSLMERYTALWDSTKGDFEQMPFSPEEFAATLETCVKRLPRQEGFDSYKHLGFIRKRDVKRGTKVYVRADLHGDLKSFINNLHVLRKEGILDEKFRCIGNVQLIFCGDFTDRGSYSLQVLQLLAVLQFENPENVDLVRGNHEYLSVNYDYGDENFRSFLFGELRNRKIIEDFYEIMPLSVYIAQEGEHRQYAQFSHALFELDVDPFRILDSENSEASMLISANRLNNLSERIQSIGISEDLEILQQKLLFADKGSEQRKRLKMQISAKRLSMLIARQNEEDQEGRTAYNWGDVDETYSYLGDLGNRKWCLSLENIKDYLRVSSAAHKVKKVFRGHEHEFCEHRYKGKVLVSTLPVGSDSSGYKGRFIDNPDRAYIMTVAQRCEDWKKMEISREMGKESFVYFR